MSSTCFICLGPASNKCVLCPDNVYYCCPEHYQLHRSVNNSEPQCNPFIIKHSDQVGRYMVALRDIHPGEVIFQDQAAAVGPAVCSILCLDCHAKISPEDFLRCSVCQFPLCDEECKKGREHLKICAYLKGKGSLVEPPFDKPNPIYEAILPLKLLLLKKTNPKTFALVNNLMDHADQRFAYPDYWNDIKTNVVDVIMSMKGLDVTEEDILRIVGIIDTNTHEIHNQNGSSYKGIFPLGAILSHRCVVNSRQVMIKEWPYPNSCRATVFIPKGQEIFTTYIWSHLTTRKRRNSLRDGWHFSCECIRCSDPKELGALTSAVLCKGCDGGYLLHENPLEDDLPEKWKCHQCGRPGDNEDIQRTLERLSDEVEGLQRSDLEGNLTSLEKAREFLHCNHGLLTELRVRIIPLLTRQSGLKYDQIPDKVFELKRTLCKENLAVLDITSPGLTVQRGGVLFELQESEFFLAKNQLENGLMSEKQFADKMRLCKKLLLECSQCLNNERDKSIEQYYEKSATASLKIILEYIVMFS